ncbi:WxcM-like domain-containing protein, partial [Escherichia coli]|nr:WxcM-like domain-containing protein [Escherichia coli]
MKLVNTIEFKKLGDDRGSLVSLEQNKNIPFEIKRIYYIFGTKDGVSRGFHAHKELRQLAICVRGSCRFVMDDGKNKEEIIL